MLEKMKALAREKDICVLATIFDNKPHCSLMCYITDPECHEIYMVTHKKTKKYRNMVANPSVSLLIDTREDHRGEGRLNAKAMTVKGIFQKIADEGKRELVRAKLLDRHPYLREFANHSDSEFFSIKVMSLQLLKGLTDSYFETLD